MLLILEFHPIFLDIITKYPNIVIPQKYYKIYQRNIFHLEECILDTFLICSKYKLQFELISFFNFFSFSFLFFPAISILCLIFNSWVPNVCVAMTYYYEICVWKWMLVINMEKSNLRQTEHGRVILHQDWEQYVGNYF